MKQKKLPNPLGRIRPLHPYDVWKLLCRLQVRDKLCAVDNSPINYFYSKRTLGSYMFSNYNDFNGFDQEYIDMVKFRFPLTLLRLEGYVRMEVLGGYRCYCANIPTSSHLSREENDWITESVIDKKWRQYRGRHNI